jgi:hypothetical protein
MGAKELMECPTCRGGSDPRYELTPCPYCWGSRKLPQVSGAGRIPTSIYGWLRRGVTKILGQHPRFRK